MTVIETTRRTEADEPVPEWDWTAAGAGLRDIAPFVVGLSPFGFLIGAVVAASSAPAAGWAGSWLVFGGSAHLATVQLSDAVGLGAAVLTGLLVNARVLLYSAAMRRHWVGQPRWFRLVAAAFVIDPTWALLERESPPRSPRGDRIYFLTAALALGIGWSGAIAAGVATGDHLEGIGVEIVVPLCLMTILVPKIRDRDSALVAGTSAVAAVASQGLPVGLGFLAPVVVGCLVGGLAQRRTA